MDDISKTTTIYISIIAAISLVVGIVGKLNAWNSSTYKNIIVGFFLVIAIFLPLIMFLFYKKTSENKSLIVGNSFINGASLAIAFNAFNLFVIKTIFKAYPCSGFCGADNVLLGFLDIGYLIAGLIFYHVGNTKENQKKAMEELKL